MGLPANPVGAFLKGKLSAAFPRGFRDVLTPNLLPLLAADLVLAVGVLFFGWDLFEVVFLFWCETAVIGLFAILRMISAVDGIGGIEAPLGAGVLKLFVVPFFILHFGGFSSGHLSFIGFFLADESLRKSMEGGLFVGALRFAAAAIREGGLVTGILLALMLVSHGTSFFRDYLGKGQCRRTNTIFEMIRPYLRVVVTQVMLLIGGFFLAFLGLPRFFVLILIPVKAGLDVLSEGLERQRKGWDPEGAPVSGFVRARPALLRLAVFGSILATAGAGVGWGWAAGEARQQRKLAEARTLAAPLRPGLTLQEALDAAGRWESAGHEKVAIVRKGPEGFTVWFGKKSKHWSAKELTARLEQEPALFLSPALPTLSLSYPDETGRAWCRIDLTFDAAFRLSKEPAVAVISR